MERRNRSRVKLWSDFGGPDSARPGRRESATGSSRWRFRRSERGRPPGSDSARHRHAQEDRAPLADLDELAPRIEVEQQLARLVGIIVELDLALRVAGADVDDVDAPADDASHHQLVGSDREILGLDAEVAIAVRVLAEAGLAVGVRVGTRVDEVG